jgi:hypothetical protein
LQPILPGFHPDPTICRVGADYYLATSSFEYFPGVPLFHSRDLKTWEPIGHALTRESQLRVSAGIPGASKGIYAPTLRHHDGRFWLATTNIEEVRRGHLIVHADDPAGSWSEPVFTAGAIGIDPDLAWEGDGTCYLTWHDVINGGISQARVNPLTGELLSSPQTLWRGTGLANTEGPHLYRKAPWWYLLVAEGGTHTGHAVSVARSRSISGPFEAHPMNPVLSHRSTRDPVQALGHADLVELADGSWAAVSLGIRQSGTFPRFHVNGRESFLLGVDWVDEWPAFDEERFPIEGPARSFTEHFSAADLDFRWVSPGGDPRAFVTLGPDGATLTGEADGIDSPLLCTRVKDPEWMASAEVASGDGALVVRVDDEHEFGIEKTGGTVRVRLAIGPTSSILAERASSVTVIHLAAVPTPSNDYRAGPDRLRAGYSDGSGTHWVADVDGRYISTEVAGGFTGRMLGIRALGGPSTFGLVSYAPTTSDKPLPGGLLEE